jgi:hypothetical protein
LFLSFGSISIFSADVAAIAIVIVIATVAFVILRVKRGVGYCVKDGRGEERRAMDAHMCQISGRYKGTRLLFT